MSLSIKLISLYLSLFFSMDTEYNYILICTPRNCSPCIVTADDYFYKHHTQYLLVNLYESKADKLYTKQTMIDFLKDSKAKKVKSMKNYFSFGSYYFTVKNNGPFVIKYSSLDTLIFNSVNIDNLNI
jgi:hypothetical protein